MRFAGLGFRRLAAFSPCHLSLLVTLRTLLPCSEGVSAALNKSQHIKELKSLTLSLTASADLPTTCVCHIAGGSLALLAAPAERCREQLSVPAGPCSNCRFMQKISLSIWGWFVVEGSRARTVGNLAGESSIS